MSPQHWGPPIWNLFHTIVEKIKEDKYSLIYIQVFSFISQICNNLPCPDCTMHAKQVLSKINPNHLQNKIDFKNFLYVFHNAVNKRTNKPLFKYEDLEIYKSKNVVYEFNVFTKKYTSNGNMKLLADNFHRKRIIISFKKWIIENIQNIDV